MTYNFIDELLEGYTIDLEILRPNTNLYSVSLLQHKGIFHVSQSFFGNQIQSDEVIKFDKFIESVKLSNSSLAVTPEYSCPWQSIRNILNDNNTPDSGKLWVLGCESITIAEINQFKDDFHNQNDTIIIFENEIHNAGGVLLDPCCYIFKATPENGEEKTIVLIQFKTQHMGVWESDLEQQKLIPGHKVYILRNNQNSINLITIICSDALAFNGNEITAQYPAMWETIPYIVLSIQMNPKPCHLGFKSFRNNILGLINKDIISLNWSSESRASFNGNFFNKYTKSNIAITTEHIKNSNPAESDLLKQNHNKGLYYSLMKPNRHCFYLSPEIEIAIVRLRKPYPGNVNNALHRRRGPVLESVFKYNNAETDFFEVQNIGDGFLIFLNSIGITNSILLSDDLDIIDKERLINLTLGEVTLKSDDYNWHIINKLKSFLLDEMEIINRYTVSFDADGHEFRRNRLAKVEELNLNILSDPDLYPDIIASFKGDNRSEVMFLNDDGYNYKYNLVNNQNDEFATVVHLGLVESGNAERTLNNLLKLFPKEDRRNKRIVVWYKPTINTYASKSTEVPKITNTTPNNLTSITK